MNLPLPKKDEKALRALLARVAAIGLWQDVYPDGPNRLSSQSLGRLFLPEDIRLARKLISDEQKGDEKGNYLSAVPYSNEQSGAGGRHGKNHI